MNESRAKIRRDAPPERDHTDLTGAPRRLAFAERDSPAGEIIRRNLDDHAIATALTLSEDLPTTRADRTLLLQVVVNLVQNAIDAMADTAPECRRLRLSTARNSDGAIVVSVADQGAGLAEAASEKLYTPFFTTRSTGLGLGLSICRSVIEAHGGRIWHEANPGRGSTFHFTLPPETPR